MSNDLIHEVEEAVRQEKLENFWKEYGAYIIAAAVLAVLFTGLFAGWRSYDRKANVSQTAAVIQALEAENPAGQINSIIDGLRPGHRTVSHFTAAGLLLQEGDQEQALIHYLQLSRDSGIEPLFRDLARLMAVRLEWNMSGTGAEVQTTAQDLLKRLQPVLNNNNSPWRYHAHIQAALMKAHAFGNYAEAGDHLSVILTAEGIPQSLSQRARSLYHVYNSKMNAAANTQDENASQEEPEG